MSALTEPVRHGRMSPRVSTLMGSTMPAVDWCDAFWVELPPSTPDDPLYWRDALFGSDASRRPSGLMRVRDLVAGLIGLKNAATGNGVAYPVLALDEREVVVGMNDRHLDFRVALTVRPFGSEMLVVTTAVRRHNLLGRAYFGGREDSAPRPGPEVDPASGSSCERRRRVSAGTWSWRAKLQHGRQRTGPLACPACSTGAVMTAPR